MGELLAGLERRVSAEVGLLVSAGMIDQSFYILKTPRRSGENGRKAGTILSGFSDSASARTASALLIAPTTGHGIYTAPVKSETIDDNDDSPVFDEMNNACGKLRISSVIYEYYYSSNNEIDVRNGQNDRYEMALRVVVPVGREFMQVGATGAARNVEFSSSKVAAYHWGGLADGYAYGQTL